MVLFVFNWGGFVGADFGISEKRNTVAIINYGKCLQVGFPRITFVFRFKCIGGFT